MTALQSVLDPQSAAYSQAAEAMAAKLAEVDTELAKALAGGGEKYVARHHGRGKLTARERIELLVDEDSPFWSCARSPGTAVTTRWAPAW